MLNRNFPYERASRIAGDKTLIDRYFDERTSRELFLKYSRRVYSPLLSQAIFEAERGSKEGKTFNIAIAASGLFFDLARRYDVGLINNLKKLEALGALELIAIPYFHSLASLYPGGTDEFEEQVRMQIELLRKIFSSQVVLLANSHLLYNDKIARAVEALGLKGCIIEEMNGMSGLPVYRSIYSENVKVITRSRDISLFIQEGKVEEAVRLGRKGGRHVIFLEAESLAERGEGYVRLLISSLRRSDIDLIKPSTLLEEVDSGTVSVPEQLTTALSEYGGNVRAWIENSMQRLSFERMASLKPLVKEAGDAKIKGLWRMLQQSDFLLSMSGKGPAYFNIFSSPAEAFVVYNTIFVDFEGKVATWVQRIRKSRIHPK
jgi:alpha-amylase